MIWDLDVVRSRRRQPNFEEIGERASDMRPVFREVFDRVLLPASRRRWSGMGWDPLDPDTLERKTKQGLDPRVLRATDALHQVLTTGGSRVRTPGQLKTIGKASVRLGVSGAKFPQARPLDSGMKPSGERERTPARPLLGWERRDATRALDMVTDYIFGGAR